MRFRSGTPVTLSLLCSTSLAAAFAQDVTPAQLRQMTAAQFQAGIDKEGAEAFTQRVVKDIDPHSQEEPNYDIILNHISSGSEAWLRIAAEIGPYASIVYGDSSFGRGMNVAIAYALLENPTAVLRHAQCRRSLHERLHVSLPQAQRHVPAPTTSGAHWLLSQRSMTRI